MDSAIIEGYTKIGIHANHMDMTKFSTNDDPGFVDVSDELIRWTKAIITASQVPSKSFLIHVNSLLMLTILYISEP